MVQAMKHLSPLESKVRQQRSGEEDYEMSWEILGKRKKLEKCTGNCQ